MNYKDFLEDMKNDRMYNEEITSMTKSQKLLLHIAFLEGQVDGLMNERTLSTGYLSGYAIGTSEEVMDDVEASVEHVSDVDPMLNKILDGKSTKKRLPNIPDEAYTVKNGKKVVDYDKLKRIEDRSKANGFRCCSCHQSSIMKLAQDDTIVVRSLSEPDRLYYTGLNVLFKGIDIEDITTKDIINMYESEEYAELVETNKDLASPSIQNTDEFTGKCIVCGGEDTFSNWLDAWFYKEKYSEFESVCPICGNELRSTSKAESSDDSSFNIVPCIKCDECDFEVTGYNSFKLNKVDK